MDGEPCTFRAPTAHSAVLQQIPPHAGTGEIIVYEYVYEYGGTGCIPYSYTYSYTQIRFRLSALDFSPHARSEHPPHTVRSYNCRAALCDATPCPRDSVVINKCSYDRTNPFSPFLISRPLIFSCQLSL